MTHHKKCSGNKRLISSSSLSRSSSDLILASKSEGDDVVDLEVVRIDLEFGLETMSHDFGLRALDLDLVLDFRGQLEWRQERLGLSSLFHYPGIEHTRVLGSNTRSNSSNFIEGRGIDNTLCNTPSQ